MFKKITNLIVCKICFGTGSIKEPKLAWEKDKVCENCKYRRKFLNQMPLVRKWLSNNPFKSNPVGIAVFIFIIIALLTIYVHTIEIFSVLVASFSLIFIALKYKLDQANYNKDLFKERYKIFLKIDNILFYTMGVEKEKLDWRYVWKELNFISRKSYFLFGEETYQFIHYFKDSLKDYAHLEARKVVNRKPFDQKTEQKLVEIYIFLTDLQVKQNLSEKFVELKIHIY